MKRIFSAFALANLLWLFPAVSHAEGIAVVVNKSNPVSHLGESAVRDMYTGKELRWSHGGKIKLVNRQITSPIRERFYEKALHSRPEATFQIPRTPLKVQSWIQRSDAGVLQFVAGVGEAVGYVWASNADDSVKVVLTIE